MPDIDPVVEKRRASRRAAAPAACLLLSINTPSFSDPEVFVLSVTNFFFSVSVCVNAHSLVQLHSFSSCLCQRGQALQVQRPRLPSVFPHSIYKYCIHMHAESLQRRNQTLVKPTELAKITLDGRGNFISKIKALLIPQKWHSSYLSSILISCPEKRKYKLSAGDDP